MNRNLINSKLEQVFEDFCDTIFVYFPKTKQRSADYDPFRDEGYTYSYQNPIPVKAIVRDATPMSLFYRNIGLVEDDAKEIIIKGDDLNKIKIAEKLLIEGNFYSVYNKALGNRVSIFKRPGNFYRIVVWRVHG